MALNELLAETTIVDVVGLAVFEDTEAERVLFNILGAEVSTIVVLDAGEWKKFCKAVAVAAKEPLTIGETKKVEIRSKVRKIVRKIRDRRIA